MYCQHNNLIPTTLSHYSGASSSATGITQPPTQGNHHDNKNATTFLYNIFDSRKIVCTPVCHAHQVLPILHSHTCARLICCAVCQEWKGDYVSSSGRNICSHLSTIRGHAPLPIRNIICAHFDPIPYGIRARLWLGLLIWITLWTRYISVNYPYGRSSTLNSGAYTFLQKQILQQQ